MVYVLWLGIGERSEDEEVLLPWEGMQEAYPSQGDAVQEGKGQLVRPRYLLSVSAARPISILDGRGCLLICL
jgi:hypothetical protein